MTYTPRAQRLMELAQRACQLQIEAAVQGNNERSIHFLRKRAWIMSRSIIDRHAQIQKNGAR
jgi:hypothetical protein